MQNKISWFTFFSCVTFSFFSCKYNDKKSDLITKYQNTETYKKGQAVFMKNCISCHATTNEPNFKTAPTFTEINALYFNDNIQQSEYVNNMTSFLLNPTTERAIMPQRVNDFGVMTNLKMGKDVYEAVATFIFQSEKNNPNWLEEFHKKGNKEVIKTNSDYLKKGKEIALTAKALLGKNLLNAIQTKGTDKAISFCNLEAISLTQSVATDTNSDIKRVSDKNRNPTNTANEIEATYIRMTKEAIQKGEKPTPKMQEINNKMVGYYPITTNGMCLQCHGAQKDIDEKTFKMIEEKYPEDKATGYLANELRGIWVIAMDK